MLEIDNLAMAEDNTREDETAPEEEEIDEAVSKMSDITKRKTRLTGEFRATKQ